MMKPALFLACALVLATSARAQEPPAAPTPLRLESIVVEPTRPGAETLCKLRLRVRNEAEKPISGLELRVTLDGAELAVYRNQLFMDLLAPKASTEIELFNFWTTESGRPVPANGKLGLEITLTAARWLEVGTAADDTETWTLLEPVAGLPASGQLEIALRASATP